MITVAPMFDEAYPLVIRMMRHQIVHLPDNATCGPYQTSLPDEFLFAFMPPPNKPYLHVIIGDVVLVALAAVAYCRYVRRNQRMGYHD
jgi:hypothetical protein